MPEIRPDTKEIIGSFMPSTPRMFGEEIIAFTYHRKEQQPCVYLHSINRYVNKEVYQFKGALAAVHHIDREGEDNPINTLIF